GYAPAYGDRPLGAPDLEPVRRALEYILRQQEPFPALVLDGEWNVVMSNDAAHRVFEVFKSLARTPNVMRKVFDPDGIRPFVVNGTSVADGRRQGLRREIAATGSPALMRLRDELPAFPGVPKRWATPEPLASFPPFVSMELRRGDVSMAFFSTITTFATAR